MKPSRPSFPGRTGAAFVALMLALGLIAGCGWASRTTENMMTFWDRTDGNLTKRVVLIPPQSAIGDLQAPANQWGESLKAGLAHAPGIKLVEYKVFNGQIGKLPATIRSTEEKIIAAGRILGLNAVVAGQVIDLSLDNRQEGIIGFRDNTGFLGLEAEIRVFDMATGTLLAQNILRPEKELDSLQYENLRLGKKPEPAMVKELLGMLDKQSQKWVAQEISGQPWAGFVLAVDGKKVKLTVGQDTGLSEGAVLTVFGAGEKLRSGSGSLLTVPGAPLGRLTLTQVDAETSWAQATLLGQASDTLELGVTVLKPGMLVRAD